MTARKLAGCMPVSIVPISQVRPDRLALALPQIVRTSKLGHVEYDAKSIKFLEARIDSIIPRIRLESRIRKAQCMEDLDEVEE